MKKLILFALLIGVAVGTTGCFHHKYVGDPSAAASQPAFDKWRHHLIAGLINLGDDMDLDDICPSGVAMIHDRHSFLTGLVGALTFNIYTPTKVTIYCNSSRAAIDGEGEDVAVVIDQEIAEQLAAANPGLKEWAEAVALGDEDLSSVDNGEPIVLASGRNRIPANQ